MNLSNDQWHFLSQRQTLYYGPPDRRTHNHLLLCLSKWKVNLGIIQVPQGSEEHVEGSHMNVVQQTKNKPTSTNMMQKKQGLGGTYC